MSLASRCIVLTASLALVTSQVAADVIVVDASGGGETTNLPTAVALAASGDVLIVRAGNYASGVNGGSLGIVAKSLSIIADGAVTTGPISVRDLGQDDAVLLRGLRAIVNLNAVGPGLEVSNSAGQVWVEDCDLTGDDGFFTLTAFPGEPGALVSNSTHVAFARSLLRGGVGEDSFFPYAPLPSEGGPGLEVTNSSVSLHDCTVTGAAAGNFVGFAGAPGPGANGGAGISGNDADVYVSGNVIVGGPAGSGDELVPSSGFYRGGDAIELTGDASLRELIGNVLVGGAGGLDGTGTPGPHGVERDIPAGSQKVYLATARSFSVSGPTREGTSVTVNYQGKPNDLFAVYVALAPGAFPLNSAKGTWLLGSPLVASFVLGSADANGAYTLVAPLPDFGLGPDDAIILYEQVFALGTSDGKVLSAPSAHVIIDDSL